MTASSCMEMRIPIADAKLCSHGQDWSKGWKLDAMGQVG
jgi:hypothetical protein